MSKKLTLASRTDTYNFTRGMPLKMLDSGSLVPMTHWDRIKDRMRSLWRRVSRAPRTVVSEIDRDAGSITVVTERWSWRRWRWERP
jgi:hypothetical protein